MTNPAALFGVVDAIYRSALEPEHWPDTLRQMSLLLSSGTSGLFLLDRQTGTLPIAAFDPAGPADAVRDYATQFSTRDDLRQFARRQPVGEILDTQAFPRDLLQRSDCFHDFYKRWDLAQFAGSVVFNNALQEASLVVYRGDNRAPYTDDELATLAMLIPHVARSLQIWTRTQQTAAVAETVSRGLAGEDALLLIARDRRVLWLNEAAEQLAQGEDAIRISGGRLAIADRDVATLVDRFCESAFRVAELPPAPVHADLPRQGGRTPLRLVARLVRREPGVMRLTAVMLQLSARTVPEAPMSERVKVRYALTSAEAELLAALVRGETVRDYASRRDISQSTARSHLKRVLHKTDTHRQTDLVRLVLGASAL